MNILVCGDVVGQPGREAIKAHLPDCAATSRSM